MGALPKRKISKQRKNNRRAHHALKQPEVVTCPKCKSPRRPHFACEVCGYYGPAEKKTAKAKAEKKESK